MSYLNLNSEELYNKLRANGGSVDDLAQEFSECLNEIESRIAIEDTKYDELDEIIDQLYTWGETYYPDAFSKVDLATTIKSTTKDIITLLDNFSPICGISKD